MSDDLVKRYQLDYHHTRTYAEMAEDCDGDWVKYSDYKAASDRIEELEAKLAKALELAEEAFEFNIEDDGPRAWHSINDRIEELKGQDDAIC